MERIKGANGELMKYSMQPMDGKGHLTLYRYDQLAVGGADNAHLEFWQEIEELRKQRADAQATIAALQALVQELEQWVQDQSTANLETMRHTDEMQSRAMEAEQQLTQRTVELEALRPLYDDMWKQFAESQAELERVRGELVEATHNANVYQSLYSTGCMDRALLENDLRELRTLILALPKVEGEVTVRDITALYWASDGTYGSIDCKEQMVSLLQERQKLC